MSKTGTWRHLAGAVMAVMVLALAGCNDDANAPPPTPIVTLQPADASAVAGGTASFSITVTGAAPQFQWQVSTDNGASWDSIPGATAATYQMSGVAPGDSGRLYRALVSAGGATVASSPAQLTVTAAPVPAAITVQPVSQTVTAAATATFAVTATGTAVAYQWQSSLDGAAWSDIAGATAATYTTPPTAGADSGRQYRVVVSNSHGSATSSAVMLTVETIIHAAPAFAQQPTDQQVVAGQAFSFTTQVTGTPAPALQWQRSDDGGANWADLAGATSSSYSGPGATQADHGARFRLRASNSEGTAWSAAALLAVTPAPSAPVFTVEPNHASVNVGSSAQFHVAANGVPVPTFQWQLSTDGGANWSNINGATGTGYHVPPAEASHDGRRFRAVASNSTGTAYSAAAMLTVTVTEAPPDIVQLTSPRYAIPGGSFRYDAVVTGHPIPTLHWQQSSDLGTWTDIPGATGTSLELTGITAAQNFFGYRLVATNPLGSRSSTRQLFVCVTGPLTVAHNPAYWRYDLDRRDTGELFCPWQGANQVRPSAYDPNVVEVLGYLEQSMSSSSESFYFAYNTATGQVQEAGYSLSSATAGVSWICAAGHNFQVPCSGMAVNWSAGTLTLTNAEFGAQGSVANVTLNGTLYFPPQ